MKRKTTHMKLKGAGLVLALVLLAPAAAHGTSTDDEGSARAARNSASPGGTTVVVARSSGPVAVEQEAGAAARHGGLGWHEAAIGAGIVIAILLFGLRGDLVVGAVVVGTAALLGAGVTLVTRKPRGDRAGSASGWQPRQSDGRSRALWPAPEQERQ